jgi:hypothetical protein
LAIFNSYVKLPDGKGEISRYFNEVISMIILIYSSQNRHSPDLSLVGGIPTPLKNMSSSVGMMNCPIYGKS